MISGLDDVAEHGRLATVGELHSPHAIRRREQVNNLLIALLDLVVFFHVIALHLEVAEDIAGKVLVIGAVGESLDPAETKVKPIVADFGLKIKLLDFSVRVRIDVALDPLVVLSLEDELALVCFDFLTGRCVVVAVNTFPYA